MNNLFDTKEKIDQAVANFISLIPTPGWQLFRDIINANIEVVKQQILDGVEGETKDTIDRLRDKLRVYEEMRDTPQTFIKRLTVQEDEIPPVDPFETLEELKAMKAKGLDKTV